MACSPAQTLVRDLRPGGGGLVDSNPRELTELGPAVLFVARSEHGTELWRSDGTQSGTWMVRDIAPGRESSDPQDLVRVGSRVYFSATSSGSGRELWVSDGTAGGTRLVADIRPGPSSSNPSELRALGSALVFVADDGTHGAEPWTSDGTTTGTHLLADIFAGTGGSNPAAFAARQGSLVFAATATGVGRELFVSDGSAPGTTMFLDLMPGPSSSDPTELVASTQEIFFVAQDGSASGRELWASDGTLAGTRLVRDIRAGMASSTPTSLTSLDHRILFAADDGIVGTEPWISDGTAAGTMLLADLAAGTASSNPARFAVLAPSRAVFAANAGNGIELCATNATSAGTFQIADLLFGPGDSDPSEFFVLQGTAFFRARATALGIEPFLTDGTPNGTRLLADLNPGLESSFPREFGRIGTRLLLAATLPGTGAELRIANSALTSASIVRDIYQLQFNSNPSQFLPVRDGAVFEASGSNGSNLWFRSTSSGTLSELASVGSPMAMVATGDRVFGVARPLGSSSLSLFTSDGTATGTTFAALPTGLFAPARLIPSHDKFYFAGAMIRGSAVFVEPWVTDGTTAGTHSIANPNTGLQIVDPAGFTPAGNRTVFSATTFLGTEPFVTDGTSAGTQLLLNIAGGTNSSNPTGFVASGGLAWFRAINAAAGEELWVTDGTPSGTRVVADIAPGSSASSRPEQITPFEGGRVVFTAELASTGRELFISDGTSQGTHLIGEVVLGPADGGIAELVHSGSRAFFTADDGVHGRELHVSDGSRVAPVIDLAAGVASGILPGSLVALPATEEVAFLGIGRDALQVFLSDGTAAGTRQVGKFGPWAGSGLADADHLRLVGADLWLLGDDGFTGNEPWRYHGVGSLARVTSYGRGCQGSSGFVPRIGARGMPRLGNSTFAYTITDARPFAPCVLDIALLPAATPLGGCHVLFGTPLLAAGGLVTDATGQALFPMGVPTLPSLDGVDLFGQYLILDPGGALFGAAAMSDGLEVVIGR